MIPRSRISGQSSVAVAGTAEAPGSEPVIPHPVASGSSARTQAAAPDALPRGRARVDGALTTRLADGRRSRASGGEGAAALAAVSGREGLPAPRGRADPRPASPGVVAVGMFQGG